MSVFKESVSAKEKMDLITADWVRDMMQTYRIKNESQLADLAVINYTSLTDAMNGKRNFSSEIKKVLYYFFLLKSYEAMFKDFE